MYSLRSTVSAQRHQGERLGYFRLSKSSPLQNVFEGVGDRFILIDLVIIFINFRSSQLLLPWLGKLWLSEWQIYLKQLKLKTIFTENVFFFAIICVFFLPWRHLLFFHSWDIQIFVFSPFLSTLSKFKMTNEIIYNVMNWLA